MIFLLDGAIVSELLQDFAVVMRNQTIEIVYLVLIDAITRSLSHLVRLYLILTSRVAQSSLTVQSINIIILQIQLVLFSI